MERRKVILHSEFINPIVIRFRSGNMNFIIVNQSEDVLIEKELKQNHQEQGKIPYYFKGFDTIDQANDLVKVLKARYTYDQAKSMNIRAEMFYVDELFSYLYANAEYMARMDIRNRRKDSEKWMCPVWDERGFFKSKNDLERAFKLHKEDNERIQKEIARKRRVAIAGALLYGDDIS